MRTSGIRRKMKNPSHAIRHQACSVIKTAIQDKEDVKKRRVRPSYLIWTTSQAEPRAQKLTCFDTFAQTTHTIFIDRYIINIYNI